MTLTLKAPREGKKIYSAIADTLEDMVSIMEENALGYFHPDIRLSHFLYYTVVNEGC